MQNPSITQSIITPTQIAENSARKVLCLGVLLAGSMATAGELQENVQLNAENDLFGSKSSLALMIREFRLINKLTIIDAIGFEDPAEDIGIGEASFTLTGTATAAGSITAYAGSGRNKVVIPVAVGDTAEVIGVAMSAAINLIAANQPFNATSSAGVVTLTQIENTLSMKNAPMIISGIPSGLSAVATGFSGVAGTVDRSAALESVGERRYTTVLTTFNDLDDEKEWLDSRFNTTNQVLDGVLVHAEGFASAALVEAAALAINSQSVNLIADRYLGSIGPATYVGSANAQPSFVIAAQMAAVRSLRLTSDAPISDILSVRGSARDAFGGMHISTLPYFNTLIPTGLIINGSNGWLSTEEVTINSYGASTMGPNIAKNAVILGEQVTTRINDSAGNPDPTFHYLNAVDSSSSIREYFVNNQRQRYAQTRLTDGDQRAGYAIENEASIRAFMKQLYRLLSQQVITQSGIIAEQNFDDGLSVVVDTSRGKVTIDSAPLQVGQLRVVIGTITVNFG